MGERQLPELYPGWKTVRKLGSGSFGTVYEIERDLFGKIEKAALKCISIPQNDGDVEEMYSNGYDDASITAHFETYLANIVREYSMMVEMKGHTNVVYCDDIRYIPREDGIGWDITIKMELLTPLIKTLGPEFGEEQVIRLGKDLCRALALCKDRDIVHRDIKPQNIFVSKTGDYKLGDFGIAKTVEQTTGGTKIGTYSYMAPEVYHNKPYGSSADIYSLGLVMYWLLNERRLPFLPLPPKSPTYDETETARHRRFMGEAIPAPKNGSEDLKRIVLKACAFDPQERFASAQEMLDALESMGQAEPVVNKVELPVKAVDADMVSDETCGPAFGTIGTADATMIEGPVFAAEPVDAAMTEGPVFTAKSADATMTEGPVFGQKPAAEENLAATYSASSTEHMGPRTIEVPKRAPQPVEAQPPQKNKLWVIGACAAVLLAVIGFAFYSMYHIWSDPTCTAPAICSICGKTQGEALNHEWIVESMETKCLFCGVVSEEDQVETDTEAGICSEGTAPAPHNWTAADCVNPQICSQCGEIQGTAMGHQWQHSIGAETLTCIQCNKVAIDAGNCGDNLTWVLLDGGMLIVSGTGNMDDYINDYFSLDNLAPWYEYRDVIRNVVIERGVTSIGEWAFYQCSFLTDVRIADSVERVNAHAFADCKSLESMVFPESVEWIGFWVFEECTNLESVTILNFLCVIDGSGYSYDPTTNAVLFATLGYTDKTVIYANSVSMAQKFAQEFGYEFEAID